MNPKKKAAVADLDTALKKSQEVTTMISSMKEKYAKLATPTVDIKAKLGELKETSQ